MSLAAPSLLPTGNRFQLSIDANKTFSIRDATGTKEVFNVSAFLRTAEVKKQIEQEVDVDDAEYQPAARGRAPLTTELADVIRPDSNFLQPPTWNYSLSKTASNRPLVALAPHADARYQNIPFKRSKVFMFYPSSTGQAPPTPSKQSQHAGVLVSDARVKFTSWSYNTAAKKYAFQLPSLPSDLEQSFLNAPPTHPHLHHSPPSSPPQQTHSLANPQPLPPSTSPAPIGTAAGLAAVLGASALPKPSSPSSPTPTGINSPPVGAVEITAWAFTAWVADKQPAQLPLPAQPNAPRTFNFGLDNRPGVEFAFLGTFTYVIPPLEHKEPEPEFPTENLKNTAFQGAQSLAPTRYDLMSALLPQPGMPPGPGPAFPNIPNGMLSSPGVDRGGTPSAGSLSTGDRAEELQWKFTQSFGDDNSSDDDLVTAMSFDHQGHYLAVGDKAGRICIFEAHPPVHTPSGCDYVDFKFYTEFQSHGPEFDCLKSLEIEERISMLRWLKQTNSGGRFLLSTNDKTIKLWKVHEKKFYEPMAYVDPGNLHLPALPPSRILRTATCKRVFGNVHQYHINSISINSDGATFMSADDLRVYVWSLEDNRECFNVVDVKPPDLQELNEVITTSTFHPTQCNTLMYGTSRGNIRLVDFRTNAICDRYARQFHHENPHPPPQDQNFFTEIISSISDCKFTEDGRYIMSRDYLTLKIWDINGRDDRPVSIVPVHDYLQPYLSDLYENDCIFDKFQCHANRAGTRYLTGSYNNNFIIYDAIRGSVCTIEAKDTEPAGPQPANEIPDVEMMDFAKKSLHLSWHPSEEVIAVAGMNKIYIYQAAISRPHL